MIIYGMLHYWKGDKRSEGGLRFDYTDERGRPMRMEKMDWQAKPLSPHPFAVLRQLSLEGWECFSIIATRRITFRRELRYYLKKGYNKNNINNG